MGEASGEGPLPLPQIGALCLGSRWPCSLLLPGLCPLLLPVGESRHYWEMVFDKKWPQGDLRATLIHSLIQKFMKI